MEKLKIAIIGAGQIARKSHITNYQALKGVEVIAVCDTNLEAAASTAEEFHISKYFGNHVEMLEATKPDAVSVCVPNKYHCSITCDALERGCHVLCEKPPAITMEEAKKMDRTAREYNRLLTYGFHFRYGNNVKKLKKKIDNRDFGDIYGARVQWIRRRGIPGWGNFTNKTLQGGGPLIDIGAHMLDLAVYLMDYPVIDYVCATSHDKIGKNGGTGLMGTWDAKKFTVEDGLFGFIKFKNGASINLETSFTLNMKEKDIRNVQLFGDKLGATLFPLELYGEDEHQQINISYPFDDEKDLYLSEVENFVNACLGKEELLVTSQQAVYIQTLICTLYDSANTGRPIML
ncbi:MAG: hypothetical protein K0R21_825 [Anaerocolumna sp.]|jgi:predicted dehydrogenase|nr:hypothetical protein [Anaerocolumna sp.]